MPSVVADKTYYVDLSSDPDFTSGSFVSVYPENLTFDDQISGVGNCSFQLSYSATDQDDNPAVPPPSGGSQVPFIGPYRSYYMLRYGNVAIQAGPIVNTSTKLGDDYMSIAGKTWEHIFERWQYPFDPRTDPRIAGDPRSAPIFDYDIQFSGNNPPAALVYQALNYDIIFILSDLFSSIMNSVANRIIFDISSLTTASGVTTNYQFSKGDMSFFNTIVDDLAGTGEGFDYWITWDRKFMWASPYRYGSPDSPDYTDSIDTSLDIDQLLDLSFSNNGPGATHLVGRGAGLATSQQMAAPFGYDTNQQQFSRLDNSYDFGDIRNQAQLNEKTRKKLTELVQPQHDIPISFDPEETIDFWQNYRVGRAIYLIADMGYHIINSGQRLKSYNASVDTEGNAKVDYTLEQIYDLALSAGVWEG